MIATSPYRDQSYFCLVNDASVIFNQWNILVCFRTPSDKLIIQIYFFLDGEDDITSLADAEIGVDRNTQKRRYSRLSDGYERLKSVLPTVKDKRRVSKVRCIVQK